MSLYVFMRTSTQRERRSGSERVLEVFEVYPEMVNHCRIIA